MHHTQVMKHSRWTSVILTPHTHTHINSVMLMSCLWSSFRLYVNWRFLRGIEAQFLALQKGFNEVIPQHLLKAFDEKELEVLEY